MKDYCNKILLVIALVGLSSCSGNKQKTLGQLKYVPEEEKEIVYEKLDHKEVREEYEELLNVFEDDKIKEQIERRIADVYMIEGVHEQNTTSNGSSYYVDAIKAYRNILERYPNSPDNAEVLYQLAKAYDLEGQQKDALKMLEELTNRHPYYSNIVEAYFRMGDIYFSFQKYKKAEQAYLSVTQREQENFNLNAHYMLSWTQYKQAKYRAAFSSFSFVLDQLLMKHENLESLSKGEKPLAEDTIHSISLTLDKIGGAEAIELNPLLNGKAYVWLVYSDLGNYYLEKELFEQSADTFRLFLGANPMNKRAPIFHERIIETYTQGGFPRQALNEKEDYIRRFGIYSEFYRKNGIDDKTLDDIKTFLDELARHNYSNGLAFGKTLTDLEKLKNPDPKKIKIAQSDKRDSFAKSAVFYEEYVKTFPQDARVDEVYFLMSEALFLSEQYDKAAEGYERVAYEAYGDSAKKHEADSGYAAIIAYQRQIALFQPKSKEAKSWQIRAVESMLRFAEKFHSDERSPTVLTNTAEYLFGLNQYERALDVSDNLISNNPSLDKTLKKTALGIMAHSYFKLEDYVNAQASYLRQRELVDSDSGEYTEISERLASTTYKNYEVLLASNQVDAAIDELLKVKVYTPDSPVRPIAQYDAVSLLLENQRWPEAINELIELAELYPDHELSDEFPRKLAFAYKSNQQWDLAAEAYLKLFKTDREPEIKREALFLTAEMYEKSMSYDTALKHYKQYAYTYEEPFSARMEARYKLALIYETVNETGKSLYWLRRVIAGDKEGGENRNERSRWLAAWAHMQYGDYFAKEYRKVPLRLPLAKSLVKKQAVLTDASEHYQQSADFGFLEFVTMSSYKIAGLYTELATGLRNSPRPKKLSKEDLVTYNDIVNKQAEPLDDVAKDLHLANVERAWSGKYNEWIEKSFSQLRLLAPERFNKNETIVSYGDEIR